MAFLAALPEVLGAAGAAEGGAAAGGAEAGAAGGGGARGLLGKFGGQALKYKGANAVMSGGDKDKGPASEQGDPTGVSGVSSQYSAVLQPGQFH